MNPSGIDVLFVVEDSDEDFDTLREVARDYGVENRVRRAVDGDDCLQQLRETAARRVVLVLMDLGLPGTDGRTALAAIRADARLCRMPVVVFSTSDNPRDVEHCYRSGANAYHVKPHRYLEHRQLLRDLIHYWCSVVRLPDRASET